MCRSSVIGRKKVVKPNYPYFCSRNTELMQIACRPPTEPKAQSSWNGWSSQSSVGHTPWINGKYLRSTAFLP